MRNITTEFKVGLLVLAGTMAIIFGSISVTGWRPGSGDTYTVYVRMDSASGLLVGSPVQVAGIKIGQVESIELEEGKARIGLAVYSRYQMYADSTATMKSIGVLGDKYIDVNPGSPTQLPLKAGDRVYRTLPQNDLDSMVDSASEIMRKLNQVVDDLSKFTAALAKDGPDITGDLRGILSENRQGIEQSVQNLERTLGNLDSITGKIDRGEGTIGKLVNDETTIDELNTTLTGINSYFSDVYGLKMDVGVQTERLAKQGLYKSYLSVWLRPIKDRFYLMQFVDNPLGKTTTKTIDTTTGGATTSTTQTETTQNLRLSLLVGQRYFDTEITGGLMENQFGLGVGQYFGREDQFKVGFSVWDFSNTLGPHAKFAGEWRFFSNGILVVGVDDVASSEPQYQDAFFGIGIRFNEDNLRPLFSSLPISSVTAP